MTIGWLCLFLTFYQIESQELSLNCWRCEATVQSSNDSGVFLDDCRADFDFTQHTREKCDGKCWKSVDLINTQLFENNSGINFLFRDLFLSNLKSSRRCFSADELVRANEMGVNTTDGCRQVRRVDKKVKEVCFCSDIDMCNNAFNLTNKFFIVLSVVVFIYLNILA